MNFAVVGNPGYERTRELLSRLDKTANRLNISIHVESGLESFWPGTVSTFDPTDVSTPIDLLITLGGDGTLLRGARLLANRDIPILGINLGRVGFLNTTGPAALEDSVERFFRGDYTLQVHTTLDSVIVRDDGTATSVGGALNDIVVHKRGTARVVQLSVTLGEEAIGQYSADGIIVATPTGSTAYSLSAGGPIVVPDVEALVVTAICPHTLAVRPIVIPATSEIRIQQAGERSADVLVTIDGQISTALLPGEVLITGRGEIPKRLVRFEKERFFERVRAKLQWGDLSGREVGNDAY